MRPTTAQMTCLTLTGVDEKTLFTDLHRATGESPIPIEIGFLYSATPEGRPRYPSRARLESMLARNPMASALHVCGSIARGQLMQRQLDDLTHHVRRIQVNGVVSPAELELLCTSYRKHTIITQHNDANAALLQVAEPNHAVLVDASGGRGIHPGAWQWPATTKEIGFAGGLGPHNIEPNLEQIAGIERGWWWLDMEQRLRSEHDLFDVERARQVVDRLAAFYQRGSEPQHAKR